MAIQIKTKFNAMPILTNLLAQGNDIREFERVAAANGDKLEPYRKQAREMILADLETAAAVLLLRRDKAESKETERAEADEKAEADAIKARKDAWGRIWPITGRGGLDDFCKGAGIGEMSAFSVAAIDGTCRRWAKNDEWREAVKRQGLVAGVLAHAGTLIVSVPVENADAFAKRFELPTCFAWDAQGLRSFAMAIPALNRIPSVTGRRCRVSGDASLRCSFAPADGFKIVTPPSKVKLDAQGRMPEAPAQLLAVCKAIQQADPEAIDTLLLTC